MKIKGLKVVKPKD